jgi:DNA topoisomerase IA
MRRGKLPRSKSILLAKRSLQAVSTPFLAGARLADQAGLVVLQRNYLEVYPFDKWASSAVPDFQQDEQFMPSVLEVGDGQTSKPNLLTEADLVGLMDKNGIGKLPCSSTVELKLILQGPMLLSPNTLQRSLSGST